MHLSSQRRNARKCEVERSLRIIKGRRNITGGCASAFFCAESAPTAPDISVFVGVELARFSAPNPIDPLNVHTQKTETPRRSLRKIIVYSIQNKQVLITG